MGVLKAKVAGSWEDIGTGVAPAEVPTGCMMMWPVATPPLGWLICDGTAIPTEHVALIALVGANTPNMAGRMPLGAGVTTPSGATRALGSAGGADERVLAAGNLPDHTHTINHGHMAPSKGGATLASLGGTSVIKRGSTTADPGTDYNSGDMIEVYSGNSGVGNSLNSTAFYTISPFLAVNFIIKT